MELSRANKLECDRRNAASWPRQPVHDPQFGRCRPALGFAAWPAALRSRLSDHEILRHWDRGQRSLRPYAGVPLQWRHQVLSLVTPDRTDGSDSSWMNEPIFLRQS